MLKMVGRGMHNGHTIKIVALGLSDVNIQRLQDGKPITFSGEDVDFRDVEFIIFAGSTEQTMARQLADLVGPDTDTRIDPRVTDA